MLAINSQATTSPLGWTSLAASGVWVKELIAAASSSGDGFALVRLAPEGVATLDLTDRDRFLVVNGSVELDDGGEPVRRHAGDYLAPTAPRLTVRALGPAAVLLHVTGPALGGSSVDAYSPDGWFPAGPGCMGEVVHSPARGSLDVRRSTFDVRRSTFDVRRSTFDVRRTRRGTDVDRTRGDL